MSKLTLDDWKYIHELILFSRLYTERRNRKKLDALERKVIDKINDELEAE